MNVQTYRKSVDVQTYIKDYVNVEEFLTYCQACKNYDRKWCCPSFDFDPIQDYWLKYKTFFITGKKMILEEEEKQNWENLMKKVKEELTEELYREEEKMPGSISLSAGSCQICGEGHCSKIKGEPCRFPQKMRYSIEALGGNVGLTASKLLGINLEWIEQGKIPDYFVLIGGILL